MVGLAREGTALARFLAQAGARVTVTDQLPAERLAEPLAALADLPLAYALGGHPVAGLLQDTEAVFASPGVPQTTPVLVAARERGLPVSTETRLFVQLCPGPTVGITGSSGKTTTTSLVGEMLRAAGQPTWVGGNIGQPLILELDRMSADSWAVLELSSFQLELYGPQAGVHDDLALGGALVGGGTSPHIAAVLNVTPNHLDRHASMEEYAQAKHNILRYQGPADWVVLNPDDAWTARWIADAPGRVVQFSRRHQVSLGAYLDGDTVLVCREGRQQTVCTVSDIRLRGAHNQENVLAACAVALVAGVDPAAMREAIAGFTGVEHRLEPVRTLDGVLWVNDSIATSPERAVADLRSFDQPIVLLAGGRDKHLPWGDWAAEVARSVRVLVLFGEASDLVERELARAGVTVALHRGETLAGAVALARREARPGDVVLLAPGGTSFDAFGDFAARGQHFKELVRQL
ncbi:MAG: UDP-N-acetylmuramoyl-L-alanine--D-glutamate ligase [Chloroflexi bacterium]|nr:UDP-N-acetylmuramoyl-L-alanine--D-glutamate ligase [Chloroflexota bacterium]MBU1751622.1 UDP-N-acetylmuramoyl-L-alanine--D-glutamate ligase [Chloroflexota bacterium]